MRFDMEPASQAYSYPLLIKQLLKTPAANSPTQEIVYADKRRHTYAEMIERVHRLGNALTQIGVAQGDTVAVMDWDSHRYLECFFAVPMLGAVLQTVNVRLSPEQIAYTLNHAQAKVLAVNADFLPLLAQVKNELSTVSKFILLDDSGSLPLDGFDGEYEAMLANAGDSCDFPDFDENTRATTFYTTGTTGLPKGVYFSHRQLVLHTLAVTSALALQDKQGALHRGDVYMPITPMFHVHAWGLPYVATLAGLKQVYPGRYLPDVLLGLIEKENVTFSHCVPTIMQMMLGAEKSKSIDLSRWKVIIGGSALTTGLAQAARDRGIDIFAGYGMSETCPILTLSLLEDGDIGSDEDIALRVSTGRSIPLVDLRTADANMETFPRDGKTVGEVVVRTPWLTQGYLRNPEASEQLWEGGWLHTQDIGHIDARGYLRVTDRIKDVIKTGGEWVSSLEIEEIIARHPAVAEVAVVGVPDAKWGERPIALVVLKAGAEADAAQIRAHTMTAADAGRISKYGVPDRIEFVTQLAKTSVGKLNKLAMREQFNVK